MVIKTLQMLLDGLYPKGKYSDTLDACSAGTIAPNGSTAECIECEPGYVEVGMIFCTEVIYYIEILWNV